MVDIAKSLVNLFTSSNPWVDEIAEDQIKKSKLSVDRYLLVINGSAKKRERIKAFLLDINTVWSNHSGRFSSNNIKIVLIINKNLQQSLIWQHDCFVFASGEIHCLIPTEHNGLIYRWLEHIVKPKNLQLVGLS